jgi:PAS domain S-box-containing protein
MENPTSKQLRVLLLSEAPASSDRMKKLFEEQADIEYIQAETIKEALGELKKSQCDAVVSGIHLPEKKSGLEFLYQIRRFDQVFPFFFFTSEKSPEMVAAAFQAGANDYFVSDEEKMKGDIIVEAIRISTEIASMLKSDQEGAQQKSLFEEKYESLFSEFKEGSLIVSAVDGSISYVNDSLADFLDRDIEEIMGSSLDKYLVMNRDGLQSWQDIKKAVEESPGVIQISLRRKDGSVKSFWSQVQLMELKGKPTLLCQLKDITRLEKLESEIYSVKNQLKVIVENSADAIILAQENGLIEYIGGAAPKMFGVSPDDMKIADIDDLFGKNTPRIKGIMAQMGRRLRVTDIETQVVTRWRTSIPVSIAITKLPSSDMVTRYLFNIIDITQQQVMEAERLLVSDLVNIMSSGSGPMEAMPQFMERLKRFVPIEFGLIVAVDDESNMLKVAAVYNSISKGKVKLGQVHNMGYLPVEEELWIREGIMRNNLQPYGLHPLENLLFEEGVRSYLSFPLMSGNQVIGGAHFGSSRAYALNRGHLSLFKEIANAFCGAVLKEKDSSSANRFRFMFSFLLEKQKDINIFADLDGRILAANEKAGTFLGDYPELAGKMLMVVLRERFPSVPGLTNNVLGKKAHEFELDNGFKLTIEPLKRDKKIVSYLAAIIWP